MYRVSSTVQNEPGYGRALCDVQRVYVCVCVCVCMYVYVCVLLYSFQNMAINNSRNMDKCHLLVETYLCVYYSLFIARKMNNNKFYTDISLTLCYRINENITRPGTRNGKETEESGVSLTLHGYSMKVLLFVYDKPV